MSKPLFFEPFSPSYVWNPYIPMFPDRLMENLIKLSKGSMLNVGRGNDVAKSRP